MKPLNSTQPTGNARLERLGCWLAVAGPGSSRLARAGDDAAAPEQQRAILMQRFVVSATRIGHNPWRYASAGVFEVLSRASEHDTNWWLDALRRGLWLGNRGVR